LKTVGFRELKLRFREFSLTLRELFAYGKRCGKIYNNSITQGNALQFTTAKPSIHAFVKRNSRLHMASNSLYACRPRSFGYAQDDKQGSCAQDDNRGAEITRTAKG